MVMAYHQVYRIPTCIHIMEEHNVRHFDRLIGWAECPIDVALIDDLQ